METADYGQVSRVPSSHYRTIGDVIFDLSLNNIIVLMMVMKVNECKGHGHLTREDFNPTGKHINLALRHIYMFLCWKNLNEI